MAEVYTSMKEVRKEFFPRDYQKMLIRKKNFGELANYLTEENTELDFELTKELSPEEVGNLLAEITLSKIEKLVLN